MRRGITPVVAVVLLLMMSVTAAGGAYVWITTTTQQAQDEASDSLSTRLAVRDVSCEPGAVRFAISNTGDRAIDAGDTDLYVYESGGELNTTREAVNVSGAGFEQPGDVGEVGFLLHSTQRPGTAYRFELVFDRSDYRTSARCEMERNALPGAIGGYDSASRYVRTVEMQAAGNSADDLTHGYWLDGTKEYTQSRSYGLMVVDRDTGAITYTQTYDIYGSASEAGNLAANLSSYGSDSLLLVNTYDEPQNNRKSNGLPAEMNATGATDLFVAPDSVFRYRSAYMLIGYHGIGQGSGMEYYRGDEDRDADAHITRRFRLVDGNIGLRDIYR